MQLISLNIWGGHIHKPLLEFISRYRDVEVFCFQEVYFNALQKVSSDDKLVSLNIFTDLQAMLPDHQALSNQSASLRYLQCTWSLEWSRKNRYRRKACSIAADKNFLGLNSYP